MGLRIGIDVGGTATDAVVLDSKHNPPQVLAKAKVPTTPDVLSGISAALQQLQQQCPASFSAVVGVFLGTTQFVNAVVQLQGLAKVFVVRLCGTATHALPPFVGMPTELREAVAAGYVLSAGGLEFDGVTEISHFDDSDITRAADQILKAAPGAVVVSGVHATLNPAQEVTCAQQLKQQLEARAPGRPWPTTLCHQVSPRLGLLERESAAILNAALQPLAAAVIPTYRAALDSVAGLQGVPLYLSGNDGTLVTSAQAQQLPILTFRSGPVNSLRGAVALSGCSTAVVMDIGGTTTDTAAVVNGLPRMSGSLCDICGVTTSFRLPMVSSIGLGGGSVVSRQQPSTHHDQVQQQQQQPVQQPVQQPTQQQLLQQQQCCQVGSLSVGSAVSSSSLVCGGSTLTASDVAVLLHDRLPGLKCRAEVPPASAVLSAADSSLLQDAWQVMQHQLAAAVDAARTSIEPVSLVVVGGGAGLCGDTLPGACRIITPEHAEVANAVGAAIASVAGTVDTLLPAAAGEQRQQQIQAVVQQAIAAAVATGAVPATVEVVEQEEVAVSYGPVGSVRLHVRAVGELQLGKDDRATPAEAAVSVPTSAGVSEAHAAAPAAAVALLSAAAPAATSHQGPATPAFAAGPIQMASDSLSTPQHATAELESYTPTINPQGLWELSDLDLNAIAVGAQILGAGGGGSARLNRIKLQHAMEAAKPSAAAAAAAWLEGKASPNRLAASAGTSATAAPAGGVDKAAPCSGRHSSCWVRPCVLSLADLPDSAMLCDVGGMGAPTVSSEKLDSFECAAAVRGLSHCLPAPLTALLCAEVGGGNALEPLAVGLELGLPVVDADLMGRAFPELQMSTAAIAGVSMTPACIADDKGNVVVMTAAAGPEWAEKVFRAACTEMGCSVGLASTPMTGKRAKEVVVPGSLSLAWSIGLAVLLAQGAKADPVAAILQLYQGQGRKLLEGKVVNVQCKTEAGFVRGSITVNALAGTPHNHLSTSHNAPGSSTVVMLPPQPKLSQPADASESTFSSQAGSAAAYTAPDSLEIEFQNENIVARASDGEVLGCVPDLICVLDTSTGAAVATEEVRYGLLVTVVVLPAHPLLRTHPALQVVGPAAFGYRDVAYTPVGRYPNMPTVHESFSSTPNPA